MNAPIVVVGGGVIGLCTAFFLLERGCEDILVLERATAGAGSTGRASGGIRQQFAREVEVRMAVESVAFWHDFDARFEAQIGFNQVGYLYLLTTAEAAEAAERQVALQQACGAPSRMLTPSGIADLVPEVDLCGVLAGTICPTDGRAAPSGAIAGLARRLRARGVTIRENTEVEAVHVHDGRVTGVTAAGERIGTSVVINAAGPHAAAVAGMVGLDLPVRATRMHQFVTAPLPGLTPGRPVLVEPSTTLFAAEEAGGMLLGMRQAGAEGEHLDVDEAFWPEVLAIAARRIPALRGARLLDAWTGLVEMSPDHVGIVGPAPEVAGFICANGLSGHGFMLAPAVGRIAAACAMGDTVPGIDMAALSPLRFRA